MGSNPNDFSYQQAVKALNAAQDAYAKNPTVETLINVYQAQNAVRVAAGVRDVASLRTTNQSPASLKAAAEQLGNTTYEPVPGESLAKAQALLTQIRQAMSGGQTSESNRQLQEAYDNTQQYITFASNLVQQVDGQFADMYSGMTGQPPPPGKFSAAQTIGQTPTPGPDTSVPDEDDRPELSAGMGPQLPYSPALGAGRQTPPKRTTGRRGSLGDDAQSIYIEPLPDYAPFDVRQDQQPVGPVGQDVLPGQPPNSVTADSVEAAQRAAQNAVIPQGQKTGVFQSGFWFGGNRAAVRSGQLVFTGYQTRNSKYIDDTNPRFGSQIVATKTPTYQSAAAMAYALGKQGFPSIAAYQKAFGLAVTDRLNPETLNKWQETLGIAATNTAAGYPTTVQDAIQLQIKAAEQLAARQRAAMAAAYNVDPTASAAILGSAMKQIVGRLSNPGEDSEFHRAFNSANISTQGKVDAQQFARDWVRNKYPEEAGTMAGQDYYGAMYDVLTSGPGSLGSEAADING